MNTYVRFFLLICSLLVIGTSQAQDRNVLFIAVDDLKPLIGVYGDAMAITPNIDRLAAMGVTFTNAHCQQAVCAPSRASLLTGLRPDLTEVWDLKTMMRDRNPDIVTLPQYFKTKGFTTMGMGKIFDPRSVDKSLDKASWSQPYIVPEVVDPVYGKSAVRGYQSVENKAVFNRLKDEAKNKGIPEGKRSQFLLDNHKPSTEAVDLSDEGYFDGAMTREAILQLKKLAKGDTPFLLCVGFKKPHLPFVAPQKYWDLYKREEMPLAAFQRQASSTIQLSYHNIGEIKSYTDIPSSFEPNGLLNEDKQRELIHGYYACVSYIDAQIGRLLDALEEQGLTKNTAIVLWGDHGWHLGDHGLWCKHSNFEQATRSPLIIADPDLEQGIINSSPTEFVDIFPTLCELADLPIPQFVQGESLKPIMSGKKKKVKSFAISQYPRAKIMGYALRNERYRYVAWYKEGDISSEANIIYKELYDYKKDPLETANVVSANVPLAESLQAQLSAFLDTQSLQRNAFKKTQRTVKRQQQQKKKKKTVAKIQPATLTAPAIKKIIADGYEDKLYIGATIGYRQLNTAVEDILTREFNYTVAENAGKQARVHPYPGKWDWERIDAIVKMAQKNNLTVRLHGPISPQASRWAKEDARTAKELEPVMVDYMTAQCKRFNGHPNIKWMDVVNETVHFDGSWFGPRKGVDQWENPWPIIGSDTDKNKTPIYISKAFEIANEHAPDISLVFNQHGGMEPVMWERVKETILYLRNKGLRVDGLGWQAHLKSDEALALDQKQLDYLAELIDWAHAHQLDFHVTEIDYKIRGDITEEALQEQAEAYTNILDVLLSKRSSGVVTFNTWGVVDGVGKHKDSARFMFDENGNPKPAYFAMKKALKRKAGTVPGREPVFEEDFNFAAFPREWKRYGETKPELDATHGVDGSPCVAFVDDKCGIHRVITGLSPNTTYTAEISAFGAVGQKITLKAKDYGGEELKRFIKTNGSYQTATLSFTTGGSVTSAKIMVSRFHPAWEGPIYVDDLSVFTAQPVEPLPASPEPKRIVASHVVKMDAEPIVYKEIDTVSLKLHKYLPPDFDPSKTYAAILFFHGGSWNTGTHKAFRRQAMYFASRGMIAFSAEYRVNERHQTTPFDATEDAHDAYQFLLEHAASLQVDPEKIAVGGGSAGGHLAVTTWFWKNKNTLPKALVLFNPVLDTGPNGFAHRRMEGKYKELSPLENIAQHHPPTIILVGTEDKVLPVATAKAYKQQVEDAGGRCDLVLYEGQKHAFFSRKPIKYFLETTYEADVFLKSLGLLEGESTIWKQYRAQR